MIEIADDHSRKKNYSFDITYATNNELGFDYLRDNMKYDLQDMVQKNHNYCIVDEVDSILIDESRTPLIISGKLEDKTTLYETANSFLSHLQKNDYELDEKNKNVILTDTGVVLLPGSDFGFSKDKLITRLSFTDFDGKEFMDNLPEKQNLDDSLVDKFAPKVVEGTKKLKAWVEST